MVFENVILYLKALIVCETNIKLALWESDRDIVPMHLTPLPTKLYNTHDI
mgnify:FL=1